MAAPDISNEDWSGARFRDVNLCGAVLRAVDVDGMDIDSPWLLPENGSLVVNGVNVAPFVDAELNRRFPGRELRRAADPDGIREAWAALERTWAASVERAEGMPAGAVDESVAGEWSFAQTLRHLVMATDVWLGRAILDSDRALHPIGQPHAEYALDGHDPPVFSETDPTFERVLEVRAERQAMVRDFLAEVSPDQLIEERPHPWAPEHRKTVLGCLHTILAEEWEHHRYAVRDLDVIATTSHLKT